MLSSDKVQSTFDQIIEKSFNGKFLRNCSWPQYPEFYPIEKSDWWVDQANTPWTGVELGFASLLYFHGRVDEANEIVNAVDSRYLKAGLIGIIKSSEGIIIDLRALGVYYMGHWDMLYRKIVFYSSRK